ncbi:MAG: hypothetical protein AAF705_05535, partial [Bacteroidota bacterium]
MPRSIYVLLVCSLFHGKLLLSQAPELVIPTGHAASVTALALSPEGDYIFTGGSDGNAILWNMEGDQLSSFNDLSILKKRGLFSNFDGNQETVLGISSVGILPNGRLVTGSKSGKLIFWKPDGTIEKEVSEHSKAITIIELAPDGQHFAAGDGTGAIIYWSINGEMVWKIKRAHSQVTALTFSQDGKKLFSGGIDREIEVWDTEDGSKLQSFSKVKGQGSIVDLAISPDGQFLIAGNLPKIYTIDTPKPDRDAFIYNMEGKVVRRLDQHEGCPMAVTFTSKTGTPIVGTSNGELLIYPKAGPPKLMKVFDGEVSQIINTKKGDQVLSAGTDGKVYKIDMETQAVLTSYVGLISQIAELGIHQEKPELLWIDAKGQAGKFSLTERNVQSIENFSESLTSSKLMDQYLGPPSLQTFAIKYDGFGSIQKVNQRNGVIIKKAEIQEHDGATLRVISTNGKMGFAASNFPDDYDDMSLAPLKMIADQDAGRRALIFGTLFDFQHDASYNLKGHGKMVISAAFSSDG